MVPPRGLALEGLSGLLCEKGAQNVQRWYVIFDSCMTYESTPEAAVEVI